MHWKRTRLSVNRWEACGYRITETLEFDGRPFTLESLNDEGEPMGFSTLTEAQTHAALLNDLALLKADNDRLRIALDERRQGDAFERNVKRHQDDGRGIPTAKPLVAALAAELVTVMAENGTCDAGRIDASPVGPRLSQTSA